MKFTGKNIVIFGGTSGIGFSVAKNVAVQGGNITLIGRSQKRLQNAIMRLENPCKHTFFLMDIATAEQNDYERLKENCPQKLDGMVYSVGVADILPIMNTKREFVRRVFRVNLYGFLDSVKTLFGYHENSGASIVGISSGAADYPSVCQSIYAASKAAMNIAVKALAQELYRDCIRINTVMPSTVETNMIKEALENGTMSNDKFNRILTLGGCFTLRIFPV